MANFLDKTGLSTVWGRIKSLLYNYPEHVLLYEVIGGQITITQGKSSKSSSTSGCSVVYSAMNSVLVLRDNSSGTKYYSNWEDSDRFGIVNSSTDIVVPSRHKIYITKNTSGEFKIATFFDGNNFIPYSNYSTDGAQFSVLDEFGNSTTDAISQRVASNLLLRTENIDHTVPSSPSTTKVLDEVITLSTIQAVEDKVDAIRPLSSTDIEEATPLPVVNVEEETPTEE